MDNLTHSIAGAVIAAAVLHRCRGRVASRERAFRLSAFVVSIFSNNAPDLDFVYAGITEGRLGYLLHHRGHTHTLAAVAGFAVLAIGLSAWLARWTEWFEGWQWRTLAALGAAGGFLHIALDFTNNYGVHPFWPIDNSWYYGDSVFIVEPLLWAVTIPPLFFLSRTRVAKVVLAVFLAGALVLAWTVSLVSMTAALLVTTVSVAASGIAWKLGDSGRLRVAIGGWIGVTAVFVVASARAGTLLGDHAEPALDNGTVEELVLTPGPANPFCWNAFVIESNADRYTVRAAAVAPFSSVLSASGCPKALFPAITAPITRTHALSTEAVRWEGEFSGALSELRAIVSESCHARAYSRFARVPFWTAPGAGQIIGDLRYDRNPGADFAEITLGVEPARCPENVPPWEPPRSSDVLR